MSLLARRSEHRSIDSLTAILEAERGGPTWSGSPVTAETAMQHGVVWSCVNLIADVLSTIPIDEYTASPGGISEQVDPSPLVTEPSALVDPISWRRQVLVSGLIRGNTYGIETATAANGWPRLVEIAHPDWIGAHQAKRLAPVDWYMNGKPLDRALMRHLPAYTVPGVPIGLSPIDYQRQAIGLGLAVQKFGAQWFGDGAHPTALIKSKKRIDQKAAGVIKERVLATMRGNRDPLVLGEDLDYQAIQITPEQSQFLATIKANRGDIAAIYFPHMVLAEGSSMTYANVEARSLDLLVYDLGPWIIRLEKWISRMLPRARYVKLNTDALVRTSLLDRMNAHQIALRNGARSRNEWRQIEDEAPLPDGQGDEFLWPPYRAFPLEGDVEANDPNATGTAPVVTF